MAIQKVNTEGIMAAASTLTLCNNTMNEAFASLYKSGTTMENNWNSKAGSVASSMLYQILNGNEARSTVLENYVNLLQQSVATGYVNSETMNIKLSDQFL